MSDCKGRTEALVDRGPILSASAGKYKRNTLVLAVIILLAHFDGADLSELAFFGVSPSSPKVIIWGIYALLVYQGGIFIGGTLSDWNVWHDRFASIHDKMDLWHLFMKGGEYPLREGYSYFKDDIDIRYKSTEHTSVNYVIMNNTEQKVLRARFLFFGIVEAALPTILMVAAFILPLVRIICQ